MPRPEACAQRAGGLRIVSYATTPVAGVPAILARCIASVTGHSARCVWATEAYGNGVAFSGDVQWRRQPREAAQLLEAADLVIVHNGKVDAAHRRLLESKPVVTMAHNYGWNVDWHFVKRGLPGVVVGQYQATLPEFAGWTLVPNPIPLWETEHLPGDKGDQICIAFTPSGRHDCYPEGHRLYWHSKGCDTTMRVLERLGRQRQVRVETTAQGQVSHAKALAMKRGAHIVIDECVTGSYHRNSLEGLAVGSVVVNGFGLIPGVREAFVRCAGDCPDWLFTPATLATLEARLDELVSQGPQELLAQGRRRRSWMEAHWDFRTQWDQHWRPVIEQAINDGHRHRGHGNMQAPPARQPDMRGAADATVAEGGMSVVVPFSGSQRLGLLAATLAGLRQSAAVDQIIVAEVGSHPLALDVVQRWDADYVFITSLGSFDKARAVNTGSTLARQSEILWCDGDLLFGDDFLSRAQRELRARGLDFLFPFSRIEYLDDAQSRGVCAGTRSPVDCRAVRVLRPMHGGAIGGVGLVRAQFLRRYGGMIEGFLGWGGEDNAWVHKASLLGRVGVTEQADQVAWHLYHPDSGATGGQPWRSNPEYAQNVELLSRVQCIRTADELLREFPQPAYEVPPWPARTRLGFVAVTRTRDAPGRALAASWADRLSQAYGITVQVLQTDPGGLAAALEALCAEAIVGFVEDAATCAALAARLLRPSGRGRPGREGPGRRRPAYFRGWPLDCRAHA